MLPPQQPKTGLTSLQTIGIAWGVLIAVLVVGCLVVNSGLLAAHRASSSTTLSDAPVSACDGAYGGYYPLAPGTIIAQVNGQPVTHFYSGQPFQLVYTGDAGDSFAPQQIGIDAYPNFDGATHAEDVNSAPFQVTAQDIHGTSLTIPVSFPFTAPKYPNRYTRPGPYCFTVGITYTRPDGQLAIVTADIGLYEEAASAT